MKNQKRNDEGEGRDTAMREVSEKKTLLLQGADGFFDLMRRKEKAWKERPCNCQGG